jgi:TRAP-type transport system small permease protein
MNTIKKIAGQISNSALYLSCFALLILTFLMTINVFARYLFNAPLSFADEFSIYLFLIIIFLGLEYTWIKREHIRIEFFIQHIPVRIQNYLEGVLHILWLVFCILLMAGTINLVITFYQRNVHAFTVLETALYIPALIMPIGMAVFLVRLLVDTYLYLRKMLHVNNTDQGAAPLLKATKESD